MSKRVNKKTIKGEYYWGCLSGLLTAFYLSGCQSQWYPEVGFGNSVNNAIAEQKANKNAPEPIKPESQGLDGSAAKASIDNYQRSFEQPGASAAYGGGSASVFSPTGSGGSSSSLPTITGR